MSFQEKDYIKRMIKGLADALARIAGARKKGDVEEAERIAQQAGDDLFPGRLVALDAVDVAGVKLLLERAAEREAYAELCRLRAAALDGVPGRASEVDHWRERAGQVVSKD